MQQRPRHHFLALTLLVGAVLCLFVLAQPLPAQSLGGKPSTTPAGPQATRRPRPPRSPGAVPTSTYVPITSALNVILGRPTSNSIALSLYAQQDHAVVIAYGPVSASPLVQNGPIQLQAPVPQTIDLTGLLPDTAYAYRLIVDGSPSLEHHFHTQRAPGREFTFTIDADPHSRDPQFNGEVYATTLTNAVHDHPDFHINLGDTFMTEKLNPLSKAEAETTFTDMRPYLGIIGAIAPLFLVNGNHEAELGWLFGDSEKELPIWSTQLREQYYPNPTPNGFYAGSLTLDPRLGSARDSYYAWTWGDALFVVLDPFWYTNTKPQPGDPNNNWGWTLGKEQYTWLKSTLEASRATYKFVFIHHLVGGNNTDARGGIEAAPFFEWGGKNADGSDGFDDHRPGWGKPVHQMLVENHVNAVFHGHDHVFVKQVLDGIVYQEVPQPSIARYNNTSLAADYGYLSGDVLGSSGHLRVTVTPAQVTVEYVRSYLPQDEKPGQQNGQVDNRYIILPWTGT